MRRIEARITIVITILALLALPSGCSKPSGPSSKEIEILQEQKAASENVTRRAVKLIKENRIPEVRQLYKNRWDELAMLRTNISSDGSLIAEEKQNIDQALRGEQEAITETLAKLEGLRSE
jgi:hypothetical protein